MFDSNATVSQKDNVDKTEASRGSERENQDKFLADAGFIRPSNGVSEKAVNEKAINEEARQKVSDSAKQARAPLAAMVAKDVFSGDVDNGVKQRAELAYHAAYFNSARRELGKLDDSDKLTGEINDQLEAINSQFRLEEVRTGNRTIISKGIDLVKIDPKTKEVIQRNELLRIDLDGDKAKGMAGNLLAGFKPDHQGKIENAFKSEFSKNGKDGALQLIRDTNEQLARAGSDFLIKESTPTVKSPTAMSIDLMDRSTGARQKIMDIDLKENASNSSKVSIDRLSKEFAEAFNINQLEDLRDLQRQTTIDKALSKAYELGGMSGVDAMLNRAEVRLEAKVKMTHSEGEKEVDGAKKETRKIQISLPGNESSPAVFTWWYSKK